jgi:hypothetical protein
MAHEFSGIVQDNLMATEPPGTCGNTIIAEWPHVQIMQKSGNHFDCAAQMGSGQHIRCENSSCKQASISDTSLNLQSASQEFKTASYVIEEGCHFNSERSSRIDKPYCHCAVF